MTAAASPPALTLCTATAREMKAVLGAWRTTGAPRPRIPEEGAWSEAVLAGRPCCLLLTGIGVINAALSLERLFAGRPDVAGVLNLGVAGSFDCASLPIGCAAAVKQEIWPEYGLRTEDGVDPQGIRLALGRVDGALIWDRLELSPESAARSLGLHLPASLPHVVSITVSGVTGTLARAERLAAQYACLLENMEGFALAYACACRRIPFVQVRTVSNRVGSRANWNLDLALNNLGTIASGLFGESGQAS